MWQRRDQFELTTARARWDEERLPRADVGRAHASVIRSPWLSILSPYMKTSPETPVKVGFESRELMMLCSSRSALDRQFGRALASSIRDRLSEAAGVPTLADLMSLPAVRCEERREAGRHTITVELGQSAMLVLEPVDQAGQPFSPDLVTRVVVARIERAHG